MSERTRELTRVLCHESLHGDVYALRLQAPIIAGRSHPGQFVFVRTGEGRDPLLRRPISICDVDLEKGEILLLYRVVGRGTDWLSRVAIGEVLDLMGPIGTPFPVEAGKALVIAGGMGIAPLTLLVKELHRCGAEVKLCYGARDDDHFFCREELKNYAKIHCVAESRGETVLSVLPDLLEGETIYTCGPIPMMAAVQRWAAEHGGKGYASLEERMACGIGACSGCAFPMRGANGTVMYKKVCVDGPVFPLEEVLFGE